MVAAVALPFLSVTPTRAATEGRPRAAMGDRITISNKEFFAGGQRIWMNGANTPWHAWNDFGGNYDAAWWNTHFQELHNNGVNSIRVWITCSGEVGINIDANGVVTGATAKHWQDLDSFFQIAQQNQIYIMATLISFDHFKNTYSTYTRWRNWLNSDPNIDSYVNSYLIPFVNRYETNPYLWSIDLINEPDWVVENQEVGQFPWSRLQSYWARASRAIHENSPILVTVGMGMPKYNATACSGCQGNKLADSVLKTFVNDPEVYMDFYSSHYYPWQDPYFGGIPFYKTPVQYYGEDLGKLTMIGETPANGSTGHTLTQDYENAYLNGWQGVMPWTSNGVDSNGGMAQLSPATTTFRNNHPQLVFPSGGPTPTRTNTPIASNTPTNTAIGPTSTRTNTPVPSNTPTNTAIGPTPTRTNTPLPSNTPTNTAIGPTPTRTNTPIPSNTPTNTPIPPTPTITNTPVPGGNPCSTPTVITGGGSYSVSMTGTCFKYVNATFTRGGMFSVMNPGDSTVSNTVKWYGGRNETVTNCINDTQVLNGNGAQINNFTVAKDSNNAMFVTVTGNKVNTITLSIQNWQNGTGCSVAPTPQP